MKKNLFEKAGRLLAACILLSVVMSPAASWAAGTMKDIGTLGGNESHGYGVNDAGDVVGWSELTKGSSVEHAFLYSGGTMHDLGTLGGEVSEAYAINNSGQAAGYSATDLAHPGYFHAFLYSGGTMHDLGHLGGNQSKARGINNSGQVTGFSVTDPAGPFKGYAHAFVYSGGTMHDIGTLNNSNYHSVSYGNAINSSGQVAGWASPASNPDYMHAFLYSGGVMTDLGTLGGSAGASEALGINDAGDVVGYTTTITGTTHAFLYSGGVMHDLGTLPGGNLSKAFAISNSGQIVGFSTTSNATHAFLYSGGVMYDLGVLHDGVHTGAGSEAMAISNSGAKISGYAPVPGKYDIEHAFLYSSGDGAITLSVSRDGSGSGVVTSAPSGINCGSTCSASFNKGVKVTLTPAPDSDSVFAGWSDACTGKGTCVVTMSESKSVKATFNKGSCTYSLSSNAKKLTYKGGKITAAVTTAKDDAFCPPPAIEISANDSTWITATATALNKNKGSLKITVSGYDLSAQRTGAVIVGETITYTVTQTGQTCVMKPFDPKSGSFTNLTGTGEFTVTAAPSDCAWEASADPKSDWITVTQGTTGKGQAHASYTVQANTTTKPRTGKILVKMGKKTSPFVVKQAK